MQDHPPLLGYDNHFILTMKKYISYIWLHFYEAATGDCEAEPLVTEIGFILILKMCVLMLTFSHVVFPAFITVQLEEA